MGVHVSPDPKATARAAADRIAESIAASEGVFSLAVAGGSTPLPALEMLASMSPGWDRVTGWLSDERWVPPDDARSNGAAAARALFDHVGADFVRPMWSVTLSPGESAADYEAKLRTIHEGRRPDVIMLGIGDDGHTASLFPATDALGEQERWYVANRVPQLGEDRLTATFPLLWSAKILLVMVIGRSKASALAAALHGEHPSGRLAEGDALVEWYVDEEAASRLG